MCPKRGGVFPSSEQPPVPGQGLHAAVIGGLGLRREEAAGHALVVVPVVGHTLAAFAMPGAVIRTGAGTGVVTGHKNFLPFLFYLR